MGCVCNGNDTKSSLGDWNLESSWSIEKTVLSAFSSRASQNTRYSLTFPTVRDLSSPWDKEEFFTISAYHYSQYDALTKQGTMNNPMKKDVAFQLCVNFESIIV